MEKIIRFNKINYTIETIQFQGFDGGSTKCVGILEPQPRGTRYASQARLIVRRKEQKYRIEMSLLMSFVAP